MATNDNRALGCDTQDQRPHREGRGENDVGQRSEKASGGGGGGGGVGVVVVLLVSLVVGGRAVVVLEVLG